MIVFVLAGARLVIPAKAAAPDPAKGAEISTQCAVCHGSDGISVDTSVPNLAGQRYPYLLAQLNAFKQGTRKNPMMNELARPLSQEQIEDIAAYYASISIHAGQATKSK
ncbi:MAG: cytochrome c [Alphaproteobacteria bacterium]|nr:cytochrome c [Alphaproteobacteria bacterium]